MVEFLYGSYGSGKTDYILNKIKQDVANGTHVLWLVPEQKTIICERTLATSLDPSAQLLAEAVNFTRLCDKVFRLFGGLKYNYITKSGKSLIMYRALCEVMSESPLSEYKIKSGQEHGCVSLFLDAIGELKSYAISAEALLEASKELKNKRLKRRILDLVRVFERYNRILRESYSDPYDDLFMLKDKLLKHKPFKDYSIYISSFYGFTGAQLSVLKELFSQAKEVVISLDLRHEELDKIQYKKLTSTARGLEGLCRELKLETKRRSFHNDLLHKKPALKYLSENIWRFDALPCADHEGITLIRPSDEFDECDTIASKIKALVMNGARYSEIAVIMRNTDTYRGIINYSFDKYGIPYYMSSRTDVSSRPLIKMLYSAINASQSWGVRDIASFMRSGYANISNDEADELESYMYRWGIYGSRFENDDYWSSNPDGYVTETTELQNTRLAQINNTRQEIIKKISILKDAFERKSTARELCLAVYNFIVALDVKGTLSQELSEASKEEAMELSQLYSAIMDALDTIVKIMPDAILNQESFLRALSYVLDGVSVGTIPTGEDNVTIGEALSLRTEKIKYAFVIGVTLGSFPATIQDTSFFSDADKRELKIPLSEKSDIRADSELLNFKNSIAVASHEVVISSPRADIRGAKKEPSVAYTRIKELFPSLASEGEAPIPTIDKIYTKSIAREFAKGDSSTSQAIRALLNISHEESDLSNERARISKEGARALLGKKIHLSQSQIEKLVRCRFQYYCTYLLKLSESDKIAFGASEVGVLAHTIFELFLKRARDNSLDFNAMTREDIKSEIDLTTETYIARLCPNGLPSSRLRHLFNRLKSNIIVYVREVAKEFAQSEFKPELFELEFSRDGGIPPLEFDAGDGAKITLSGIVDRVDIYRKDDTAYLRVVDYKTGKKKFTFDDFDKGLELQLFIYLFTLCEVGDTPLRRQILGDTCKRLAPAGAMYFPMRLGKSKVDKEVDLESSEASEEEEKAIASLVKRSGVFLDDETIKKAQDATGSGHYVPKKTKRNQEYFLDENGFKALRDRLEGTLRTIGARLLSGDASAKPMKLKNNAESCEYCPHRAMCRRRKV